MYLLSKTMKNQKISLAIASTALGLLCFSSSGELSAFTASVQAIGMAGAATANPMDAMSAAYNPASIGLVGDRVDVEATIAYTDLRAEFIPTALPPFQTTLKTDGKWLILPQFAISKQWCNWGFGVVCFNEQALGCDYNETYPLLGASDIHSAYASYFLSPTVSYHLPYGHTIGVSIPLAMQFVDNAGVENLEAISVDPDAVTGQGSDYSYGITFAIGWSWQVFDCLRVGASYQMKTSMSKLKKYQGSIPDGKLDIPDLIKVGISYKILPCTTIAFDVHFNSYEGVTALHNGIDKLDPTNGVLFGSPDGPGFGWMNQWYYRIGINHYLTPELQIRAGFRHANCPITQQNVAFNALSMNVLRDYLTVGATYTYDCTWQVSGYYAYGFEGKKNGPDSFTLAPGGGDVNLSGQAQVFGLQLSWLY